MISLSYDLSDSSGISVSAAAPELPGLNLAAAGRGDQREEAEGNLLHWQQQGEIRRRSRNVHLRVDKPLAKKSPSG